MAKGKKSASPGNSSKHGVKDIQSQLDAIDGKGWDDTEENEGFGEVPTNDYQIKFEKITINNSKNSGRLQVSFEMTIQAGKLKNRKLFKHEGLDTPENRGRLRASLAKLGVAWPKASELPATLEELVGTYAEVHVDTKPSTKEPGTMSSWTNFKKALDEDELDTDDAEEEEEDDEEEDEEEKPKPKKGKKKPEEDEEDEEEEDEEDEAPAKKGKKKKPVEDDDDDEEEDDEEEDEPAPKSKSKAKKKPADDEEDEDEDEEPAPKKGKGKTVEEASVEVTFDDDDIDKLLKKRIAKVAKTLEYDEDNYEQVTQLLTDLAEHVGLSGKFADPKKLIVKIEERAEDEDDTDAEDDD
jgi:hypothetical protein